MTTDALFEGAFDPAETAASSAQEPNLPARLLKANRAQSLLRACDLDDLIPQDHRARGFWQLLESADLASFDSSIKSVAGRAGRPAIDPRVLLCLWLYATSEGIGSARHLARLCERDAPYQWICGGLSVSAHTLSDFRVNHAAGLDGLMAQYLAVLMKSGQITLARVAHDGARVRANAGSASFRREKSLKDCLKEAQEQVARTKAQLDDPAREESKTKATAQCRAAQERNARVEKALAELEKLRNGSQKAKEPSEVRASTTDPEARNMRMADNGFRPAYNVQAAVDTEARIIVGVDITNSGSDLNQIDPMLDRVKEMTGKVPQELLVDGGFSKKHQIECAAARGVDVYAPTSSQKKGDPSKPRGGDGLGVSAWRSRMATPEAGEIYKERASTIELVFADLRAWRGMKQFPVRGQGKCLAVATLMALTFNFIRMLELGVSPG